MLYLKLLHLLAHVRSIERQSREHFAEEPQAEQELVLEVRLQDGQADPEELDQNVHLVILGGLKAHRIKLVGKVAKEMIQPTAYLILKPERLSGTRSGETGRRDLAAEVALRLGAASTANVRSICEIDSKGWNFDQMAMGASELTRVGRDGAVAGGRGHVGGHAAVVAEERAAGRSGHVVAAENNNVRHVI